jgi:hypothetical protein
MPPGKKPHSYNWLGRPRPYYTERGYLERERAQHPDRWIEAGPYEWWMYILVAPAYVLEWFGLVRGAVILASVTVFSLIAFGFVLGRIL